MFVHFRLTRLRSSESTFDDYRRKYGTDITWQSDKRTKWPEYWHRNSFRMLYLRLRFLCVLLNTNNDDYRIME